MRRVGRVAHQHDRHALAIDVVPVDPVAADDARETDPVRRTAQVGRIAQQRLAIQVFGEEFFAEGNGLGLVHLVDAGSLPDLVGGLDDEGGGIAVVLIGMCLEPAVLGFLEREGEGREQLLGAQPDETAIAGFDVRLEDVFIALADLAVQAVAGDDQVGPVATGHFLVVFHLGLEHQFDAQFHAAVLQDVQQALAANAAEAVAARGNGASLEMDVDVVPVVEGLEDAARGGFVGLHQVAQRLVREDHAPAEGIVRTVALDDDYAG